jgi:CDP-diglyceride synthetase
MQVTAICLIVFVIVFGGVEISKWYRPELADVLTQTQKVRRIIGLALLLILGLMLYGGTLFPSPILMPMIVRQLELIYWLSFTLLTAFIPLIAFFEFKDSLKRGSQLRREVYKSIITAPLDELPKDGDPPQKPEP